MSRAPVRPIPRVAVVGGGISGLAAAHHLIEKSQQLHLPIQLDLLEAGNRLGGVIHTIQREGFLLEGGPDSFISEKPWALSLCQKLGLEARLIGTRQTFRRSFVVRKGKLVPVPEGFYMMAPTQLWSFLNTPIFSWAGKMRMAADLFLPRHRLRSADQDESLAHFVRRRLGREALERMAQPMVGGIYTSDPEELSLRATMPRFLEMEQQNRSLTLALWRQRQRTRHSHGNESGGPRYGLFVALDRGMCTLVKALQVRLPRGSVRLNSGVNSLAVRPTAPLWILRLQDGTVLEADAVCLALPSYQSAKLLEGVDSGLAGRLRQVRFASTATVNLAYRREDIPHELDGFGFVVPVIEKLEILACTFSHVKFERRAPQNHALLRTFMGGALQPEVFEYEDEKMIRVSRASLKALLGITREPLFSHVERHPQSMAQYRVGHLELLAQIESQAQNFPTLQLAGNAYTGVGIPDCIHRGEVCAGRIVAELEKRAVG